MNIDIHEHPGLWENKIREMMSVCVCMDQGDGPDWINFFERTKMFTSGELAGTVRMVATESVQKLIFNLAVYAPFQLENIAKLQSNNGIALYSLLKTRTIFEDSFEISIEELRENLYIKEDEYKRFDNFTKRVLDPCQKYIGDRTDIRFEYEAGKTGKYGRWETIVFHVYPNGQGDKESYHLTIINSAASALRNNIYVNKLGLSDKQLVELITYAFDAAVVKDRDEKKAVKELEFYMARKFDDVEKQNAKKKAKGLPGIDNPYGYIKQCIKKDLDRKEKSKAFVESMYDKAAEDLSNKEENAEDSETVNHEEFHDEILDLFQDDKDSI